MPSGDKKVEALVLCVDRDDDLGKKAGVKGPVIGEDNNFKAAKALAMADPEDSDVNAMLAAIKAKRECGGLYKNVEVVTLTGDREVGVKSDLKLGNQLAKVLEEFKPGGVVLVTDGAEDDEILPILQSETKVLSVRHVTVKQAKQLESAYFKVIDFFGRISENPGQAKVMFGIPGLLLLLMAILSYFGLPIGQFIVAILGIYLLAKGFGYDNQLFAGLGEMKNSLMQGNIYRVFTAMAILMFALGGISSYLQLHGNLGQIYEPGSIIPPDCVADANGNEVCRGGNPLGLQPTSTSAAIINFPLLSTNFALLLPEGRALDLMLIAVTLICVGFLTHNFLLKQYLKVKKYLYLLMMVMLFRYVSPSLYKAILYVKSDSNHIVSRGLTRDQIAANSSVAMQELMIAVLIAIVVMIVVHYLLKVIFFDYIARKRELEKAYIGREVVTKKGKKLGKVTAIAMHGTEVKGIMIKRKYFPLEELKEDGKALVVQSI